MALDNHQSLLFGVAQVEKNSKKKEVKFAQDLSRFDSRDDLRQKGGTVRILSWHRIRIGLDLQKELESTGRRHEHQDLCHVQIPPGAYC